MTCVDEGRKTGGAAQARKLRSKKRLFFFKRALSLLLRLPSPTQATTRQPNADDELIIDGAPIHNVR